MNVYEWSRKPTADVLLSDNYVVLDFETTNKEKGSALNADNTLVYTAYTTGGKFYDSRDNEYNLGHLVDCINSCDFLVAHNAKFELQWLERAGLNLYEVFVWDTMIGEYVLYGNDRKPLDLGTVSKRYGMSGKEPFVDICMKGGVCPSEMPASLLDARCIDDVAKTEKIFLDQRKRIIDEGKLAVMLTRCILTPVLADLESNGVCLDKTRVTEEYRRASLSMQEVNADIEQMVGEVNLSSPKQVGELLYDTLKFDELKDRRGNPKRTAAGGRLTDKASIAQLKPRNRTQKQFLALKLRQAELNAELTKTLKKFKECVDNGEFLYAQFNQTRTATHRLSSTGRKYGVQFQNFPRKFKPLITARYKDWLVGEIDGAQLEFRVAAFLGQDTQATEDIRNGVDVHSFTSQVMTNAGQETARQEAKAHTFKPLILAA